MKDELKKRNILTDAVLDIIRIEYSEYLKDNGTVPQILSYSDESKEPVEFYCPWDDFLKILREFFDTVDKVMELYKKGVIDVKS